MIARLRGEVVGTAEIQLYLDVQGVIYEIFMPPSILQQAKQRLGQDNRLEIVTYHYHSLEVGRGVPVIIGFLSEIEKEFFLRFISVSGVGPKAAVKALTLPTPVIAQAIDRGDVATLKSLKGIGAQRAKEIIAKLQGQVGKFGLIRTHEATSAETPAVSGILEEAVAVLMQLEYKSAEAERMVRAASERNPGMQTAEEVLNEVYRQRAMQPA